MRSLISSGSPFEARVGYSRAVVQGDWCFVAGTTGYGPDGAMPEDVRAQARQALATIAATLAQAGFALANSVRVTYYLTDAAQFDVVAPVLAEVFGTIRPAATAIVVAALVRPEMKIEIEVTAFRG